MAKSKVHVLIENPIPGGQAETNMNRARRLVASGRAEFTGPCSIRFVSAVKQAGFAEQIEERRRRRATAAAYDGLADSHYYLENARHIPLIHPEKMRAARSSSH